jgi:hypothetical protein
LTDDLDRKNSNIKIFEQEKRLKDQDVIALADELDLCRLENKDI